MFLETLSCWIKQNDAIMGIDVGGGAQKLALFADYLFVYLSSPNTSLPALMATLGEYGLIK